MVMRPRVPFSGTGGLHRGVHRGRSEQGLCAILFSRQWYFHRHAMGVSLVLSFQSAQSNSDMSNQPQECVACLGVFIVMGVSGSGKTTIARALAEKMGGVFIDADDFHPPANKKKMSAGIPLTDSDRLPWLDALNSALRQYHSTSAGPIFLACSALREDYRQRLSIGVGPVRFIYLQGTEELIRKRMATREAHFMPTSLLDSQFATLEVPENAIVVDIDAPIPVIVERLIAEIGLRKSE